MSSAVQCSLTGPIDNGKPAVSLAIIEGQAKQAVWWDILIDGRLALADSTVFHAATFLPFAI